MTSTSRRWLALAVALAVVAFAAVVITSLGGEGAAANDTDGAFLTEMAPHHRSAIDMAQLAQDRAQHRELRQLADKIVSDQSREIEQLKAIHERTFGTPLPALGGHGSLGLAPHEMGMNMDPTMLRDAKPFDRAFIDAMVAHHQGAIRMARIELARGADEETKGVARAVIAAQSQEIRQMNRWREAWFGAPSPSGGIPPAGA
jgi:uncharacterized protein (DUF305 family)